MRARDMALATLALRALPAQPPKHERRLVPAVDEPDAGTLDRDALNRQSTALIASLWPVAGQCIHPTDYCLLPQPALFGALFRVSWQPLWADDENALPATEREVQVAWAA